MISKTGCVINSFFVKGFLRQAPYFICLLHVKKHCTIKNNSHFLRAICLHYLHIKRVSFDSVSALLEQFKICKLAALQFSPKKDIFLAVCAWMFNRDLICNDP